MKEREEGILDPMENRGNKELKHDERKTKPHNAKYFHTVVVERSLVWI